MNQPWKHKEVIGDQKKYLFSEQSSMFGEPDCVGFGNDDFYIVEIHRDLANEIIINNHYSKKVCSATRIHLGIIINGELLGVLQYGAAMNPQSCDSVVSGTNFDEYLELNRMWLDDKAQRNSESKALAYSIKYIRKAHAKIKWIQSFSDERCGLFGTVYQAAGFTYHGEHIGIFWEFDGEFYHNSLVTNSRQFNGPLSRCIRGNLQKATRHKLRQFRYLKFMKPRFKKGLNHKEKPYPKPDYAARLVDAPVPTGVSKAQTLGAAPAIINPPENLDMFGGGK